MKHTVLEGGTINLDSRSDAILKVDIEMEDGTRLSTIVAPGSTFSFTAGSTGAVVDVNIYSPSINATGIPN